LIFIKHAVVEPIKVFKKFFQDRKKEIK